ncbi:IclR family transcriptional regulator [Bordetella sp. FB-8]|uniref:IclR family transcriptional regulator n=1 Tax=Bordetella sp. FB-8 TaxID=1159870 RepID=UPI000371BABD|nr:IclR family transcriptional regulator [Bordetella sp. FB-8]
MNKKTGAAESGPSTLRKGLRILDVLRQAGQEGLHVVDIADAAGLQRSTAYRYLDVLMEEGYAMRDPDSPRYRLAVAVASSVDTPHVQAVRRLRPVLRQISDALGDSSFLICRSGGDSLCLHREIGTYPVQVLTVTIGHRQPLGVGSAGLALLAALPENEAREMIEQNTAAYRAYGGMTMAQMCKLADNTRTRGWSVVGNSAVPGVLGVGVALRDETGYPRLAISVSSTIDRMPAQRQRIIAELIREQLGRPRPRRS